MADISAHEKTESNSVQAPASPTVIERDTDAITDVGGRGQEYGIIDEIMEAGLLWLATMAVVINVQRFALFLFATTGGSDRRARRLYLQ